MADALADLQPPEYELMGAARELVAQNGDLAAASLALQNDRCWGMYRTLMAYRAALESATEDAPNLRFPGDREAEARSSQCRDPDPYRRRPVASKNPPLRAEQIPAGSRLSPGSVWAPSFDGETEVESLMQPCAPGRSAA